MRRIALIFVLGGTLAACETVEGAGQDVQKAGEAIKDAAN